MLWRESSAQPAHSWTPFTGFKRSLAALILIALLVGWSPWSRSSASQPAPGILVYGEPLQNETTQGPWQSNDYTFTPLASYEITARILAKKSYTSDRSAELSPVDLALGWQDMSDTNVLRSLDIKQKDRWYYVSWRNAPIDVNTVKLHSANTHILPATPEVAEAINTLQTHDVVRLQGSLVQVTANDGFLWRSSLTRTDTGDGSCEVFWVTDVEVETLESLQANASPNLTHQHN